jgi:hypothetical protein
VGDGAGNGACSIALCGSCAIKAPSDRRKSLISPFAAVEPCVLVAAEGKPINKPTVVAGAAHENGGAPPDAISQALVRLHGS